MNIIDGLKLRQAVRKLPKKAITPYFEQFTDRSRKGRDQRPTRVEELSQQKETQMLVFSIMESTMFNLIQDLSCN